jgi:hypothetical protein
VTSLRKALISVAAIVAAAATYAWMRPSTPHTSSTREVKGRVISMDELLDMARVKAPSIWHQEAETIRIERMVEAGKAEWERDAAARRGHTEP